MNYVMQSYFTDFSLYCLSQSHETRTADGQQKVIDGLANINQHSKGRREDCQLHTFCWEANVLLKRDRVG